MGPVPDASSLRLWLCHFLRTWRQVSRHLGTGFHTHNVDLRSDSSCEAPPAGVGNLFSTQGFWDIYDIV